jgi:hypothetical protein
MQDTNRVVPLGSGCGHDEEGRGGRMTIGGRICERTAIWEDPRPMWRWMVSATHPNCTSRFIYKKLRIKILLCALHGIVFSIPLQRTGIFPSKINKRNRGVRVTCRLGCIRHVHTDAPPVSGST